MAMTTPDQLQQFLAAQQAFGSVVHRVGADQWSNPTPCSQWNVRALVNHLVYEQLWATPMLEGVTVAEVGDRFDGDLLGSDPVSAWDLAAKESAAAFSAPGALDRTTSSSRGPLPARQYIGEMTMDLLVHRWDLGQGIGDEQRFTDDELGQVEAMVTAMQPMQEQLQAAGVFGAPVAVDAGADAQARALAAMGRRA
jgi:uncharacterized protein (TIGR03086 family)